MNLDVGLELDDLLEKLGAVGIRVWVDGGELRFRAPRGALTSELRDQVKQHRPALVARLGGGDTLPRVVPDPESRHRPFPLTEVQAAYLTGRSAAYEYGGVACQAYVEVGYGDLDPEAVRRAWTVLVRRHGALRTLIHPDGTQHVLEEVPELPVGYDDLRAGQPGAFTESRLRTRSRMENRDVPPDRWPLIDLHVTRGPEEAVLHLGIDLLAADYAGVQQLLAEFDAQLTATPAQEPAALTFRDYVTARRALTATATYQRDRAYWRERAETLPGAPELPLATGGEEPSTRFTRHERVLGPELLTGLESRSRARDLALSSVLMTAYALTIARWSRHRAFTLTVPTFGRLPLHDDIDRLVGDFTTIELLEVDLTRPRAVVEHAREISARLLEDLDHALFPGTEVAAELARLTGTRPLLPVVFTSTLDLPAGPAPTGSIGYVSTRTPQVWIDCQAVRRDDRLVLSWDTRDGVLAPGVAAEAFETFAALVSALAEDDAAWDRHIDDLPPAQAARRTEANDTRSPLPEGLLHDAFLAQAARTPDAVALDGPGGTLTYAQLLGRARAVAAALEGVAGGAPVAVYLDKSPEQIVAVLGVLLAGAAYLPVEISQPAARRAVVLDSAGVRTVVTSPALAGHADPSGAGARRIVVVGESVAEASDSEQAADPDDLAYVIYTSGSTGVPKGVMISHRAALNTLDDVADRISLGPDDAVLGLAGLGFDLSVFDVFAALGRGATLVLPDPQRRGDPSHWAELAVTYGISVWNSVPGQMQMLVDYLRSAPDQVPSGLRVALLSGDWIPVTLPDAARALMPRLLMISMGGATEAAVWSIWHTIGRVDPRRPSIPYGKPLANQTFHVLDDDLRPVPDWCPGELYIGGAGVALGYLGDAERTAERFITRDGERLYRTGDLGRYRPDGEIEFLGREDNQVKIRGYRIELAEVEAAVLTHPAVGAAAALVGAEASGARHIVGVVEPAILDPDLPDLWESERTAALGSAAAASRLAQDRVDPQAFAGFRAALADAALTAMAALVHERVASLVSGAEPEALVEALGAGEYAAPVVRRWLPALAAAGRLNAPAPAAGAVAAALTRLDQAARTIEHGSDLARIVTVCIENLGGLVDGSADVRELLFPGARPDLMLGAYRDNLAVAHLHDALGAALGEVAGRRQQPLRVLEVGGGVAGTTTRLVPALAAHRPDYLFTDPAAFFVAEAAERFPEHPWVRTARLDLREDPSAQGMTPNSVDVVVAGNHLHALPDVGAALGHLHTVLAPGGWLAVIEQTHDDDPALLVSTEFLEAAAGPAQDVRALDGRAFLSAGQWQDALTAAGFVVRGELPGAGEPLHPTGQRLILAQAKTGRAVVDPQDLARGTSDLLPAYMVPSRWLVVDRMPLTTNGKVDRAALATAVAAGSPGSGPAGTGGSPQGALERQLSALWAELLGVEQVGRDDDFFALGGDSLLVARLVALLRERVPGVVTAEWEVVLREMLRRPTVAALAAYLRGLSGTTGDDDSAAAPRRTHAVVPLHGDPQGPGPLTVLVHAGTGTVMPYRALITEIRRRSAGTGHVVGVEVPHLPDFLEADPEGLIEEVSARYVRELMPLARGPVHVVGYCLGGLIATEIARGLAEAGADVATFTAISSHSPRFRLDDDLLSEYSFSIMMGIDPQALGFPADELRVAAAADAALAAGNGVIGNGAFTRLDDDFADVRERFTELAATPRARRVERMCELVPATAGMYEPEYMDRLRETFRQSVFAITRYQPEPYAGDITFLRHSGAYPFPGSRDAVTQHWSELCLGHLTVVDVPGDHFTCMDVDHAGGLLDTLVQITGGAVLR
ncbi:amino acid adenylation domain-containing protein [Kineosporia sp. J2-2]|uniref:Phenyloxazoline synthase MbtB n=1 Tax=Kineosporia corallincola TaxID=2835133 RepID=A0ABS5TT86_9ACTN|nr:non-ribosomal peptide synthetase [Kineosporia corallincola]MBT0774018.1 amino acid adenylation domain-containing protein [Kineosporia corallincola]